MADKPAPADEPRGRIGTPCGCFVIDMGSKTITVNTTCKCSDLRKKQGE